MKFTGERFIPGREGDIHIEHLHRYLLACELAKDKAVLDIASGEGYGSAMLANVASHVIGVDISSYAIMYSTKEYVLNNLEFREGSASSIPLIDHSVDIVVSFETIEHHDQHELMMTEIKRVLRPGGVLLISSPEKKEYSDIPKHSNKFHVKELYREQFEYLLGKHFKKWSISGQRIVYGSVISQKSGDGLFSSWRCDNNEITYHPGISRPIYLIAIASDNSLPILPNTIFEDPFDTVAELNKRIASLHRSISWRITKPLRKFARMLRKNK